MGPDSEPAHLQLSYPFLELPAANRPCLRHFNTASVSPAFPADQAKNSVLPSTAVRREEP